MYVIYYFYLHICKLSDTLFGSIQFVLNCQPAKFSKTLRKKWNYVREIQNEKCR